MSIQIGLNQGQRAELESWVRRGDTPRKQAQRAEMILMSCDGVPSSQIVSELRISYPTLTRWRDRFGELGVDGLRQGRTRKPGIEPTPKSKVDEVLTCPSHNLI